MIDQFVEARVVCFLAPLLPPNLDAFHSLHSVCLLCSYEDGSLIFPWISIGTQDGTIKKGGKMIVPELVVEGQW